MAKVRDPVCGMIIDDSAARAHGSYAGEVVYFCSVSCQTRYERDHPSSS